MKYQTKKILLVSGISLAATGIVAAGLTTYFTTPSIKRVSDEGIYVLRQNTPLSTFGYKYDTSASFGSTQTNSLGALINSDLLHLKTEGRCVIDEKGTVLSPSYQSYKFSIANAIVLKLKNKITNEWIQIIFNSDDDEIKPDVPSKNKTTVETDSKNPNSINNKKIFEKLISTGAMNFNANGPLSKPDAKTIEPSQIKTEDINISGEWTVRDLGFLVRENVKWVDSKGNLTKYNVKVEDFWYSFMRTKLFDRQYRRANGGTKELDQYFIKKTNATSRFNENDRFPNEYLFSFFDVDSQKLYEKATAITDVKVNGVTKKMLTLSTFDNVERPTGFLSIIKKFLVNSFTFSAAPSEYIDELAQNQSLNNISPNLRITGKAKDFGIYTYGQTRTTTLYASPYVPTSAIEQREIFKYNKYFANQEWVNLVENGQPIFDSNNKEIGRKKALNKIIFEYSGGIDTSTYNSQLLSSYMKGIVSEIKYSDLTVDQRQKIYGSDASKIKEVATKNGLQYTKNINISTLVQRTLVQSNPVEGVNVDAYGFDDNYSKLVFGLTRQQLSEGQNDTTDAFFVNRGFEFRLLIQAAINWYSFINQSYQNQRVMWLSGAAQNAQFSSAHSSLTPLDFVEDVNTLQFIDRVTNPNSPTLVEITPKEMKDHALKNPGNQIVQLQSPKFKLIQENMKLILDEQYKQFGINSSDKIKWDIVYPWADRDTVKTEILKYVVDVINSLDSRLAAKVFVPKNRDEMIKTMAQNTGVSDFNGWGYDYEGIGSYIAAFSNGHGVTILNSFAIYSMESTDPRFNDRIKMLQTMFPEFTRLAKFIKAETDAEMLKKGLNDKSYWVENWNKVSNEANQDSTEYFLRITGGKYDPAVSLAQALRRYEEQPLTDKQWATLIKELNAIKGVSINSDNSILDPLSANLSLYLREYVIPITKYGILYFEDYVVKEMK